MILFCWVFFRHTIVLYSIAYDAVLFEYQNTNSSNLYFLHSLPDLDNLVKFVLDALNAKAYEDDSQIAVIKSAKFYTEGEPYTKVIIRSLTEGDFENFHFES